MSLLGSFQLLLGMPKFAINRQPHIVHLSYFLPIYKRYEKHCTLITTNMPFSKWGEILGSPTLANAVLDRLLHHSQVISIKGPSYRLKEKRAFMETQTEE